MILRLPVILRLSVIVILSLSLPVPRDPLPIHHKFWCCADGA